MSEHKILVATTNPGKLKEFSGLLSGWDIRWLSLRDFPDVAEVVEDGRTFEENARRKALGYAEATGLWTLADDSGLMVDALNGLPGVHSARFAAQDSPCTDRSSIDIANYRKLLTLLKNTPPQQRTARFICHLTLARPGQILIESEGSVEGRITDTPAGDNGFGYDPVFYIPSLGRTAAQLDDDQKNAVSHRGNAIRKLKPLLAELLTQHTGG
ncbi:MAG: RdgB/HAM1 family non-canonical purine NTP pyrophosphatase [Planctomycetaceae bacterium]|nr:RdgB/HAM1 family non-canonical purine NTP pyrophosphatase [Planctomycetaceae bacterium]